MQPGIVPKALTQPNAQLDATLSWHGGRAESLCHAAAQLEVVVEAAEVFALLNRLFAAFGSDRQLLTGLPMPEQDLGPLILLNNWRERELRRMASPRLEDTVLQKALDWHAPFILRERFYTESSLATAAGMPRAGVSLLIIPITSAFRYQGLAAMTFTREPALEQALAEHSMSLTERSLLGAVVNLAFRRLLDLGFMSASRPGELSAREREVLALTALGLTAQEAARRLRLSERTIVGHLQNAMVKLNAGNKAQAVIEGIRYRQIGPGAGYGFYQMETEIFGGQPYDYKKIFS